MWWRRELQSIARAGTGIAIAITLSLAVAPEVRAEDFLTLAVPAREEAPSERHTRPFRGEDPAYLDAVLARIFPDGPPAGTEAQALAVMSYIAQVYPSGPPAQYNRTGAEALQTTPNLCGDKTLAMVALCRRLGIPARVVPMNNFSALSAHIAVEVWYDDGWRYMDPSYGAFFYTAESYDGSGHIPSMRALINDPELRRRPFFIGEDALWSGAYDPDTGFTPLPRDFTKEPWQSHTVAEALEKALSLSFPIDRAPDRPRSFPVVFDLTKESSIWRGEIDGDPHDLSNPPPSGGKAPRHYGTHYIGPGDLEHVYHTVVTRQPAGARVRVSYHFLRETPQAELEVIPLKDAVIVDIETEPMACHFEFTAQSDNAILLVLNRGPIILLDALHAGLPDASGEQGD